MSPTQSAKESRLQHANELIKIIASHGRRFFYNATTGKYGRLELRKGRVWWINDYKDFEVYLHNTGFGNEWRGFTHGGTLRSLVEDMRDYIMTGKTIPRWKIVIQRRDGNDLHENVWGYDVNAAQAVRKAAYGLPIIEAETPV